MDFEEAKKNYCEYLFKNGSICIRGPEEDSFNLRNGGKSRIYIDHAQIGSNSSSFSSFVDAIGRLLPQDRDFTLCNVDSKISPQLVGALAYSYKVSQIVYKSDEILRLEKGPMQQLTFPTNKTSHIFFLDDVGTTGGTVLNVVNLVRKKMGESTPITLLLGIVRDPEILSEKLKKYNISYKSIATLDELLTMHWSSFSASQQKTILMERKLKV
jgi:orotate phosphoribosyltransferase